MKWLMLVQGLFIFLTSTLTQGRAQVTCFTTPSSAGELNCGSDDGEFDVASIEECCLSPTGQFFVDSTGSDGCTACIVFGWVDGTAIALDERTETYELTAGFIKGGAVQSFVTAQSLASFQIAIEERGAEQGVNEDFVVPDTTQSLFGMNLEFGVAVTVRVDGIALEPAEEFALRLEPTNPAAMDILAGGMSGLFTITEIRVVIRDLEGAALQFTESDFSRAEQERLIQTQLQLSTTIAIDLIVEVIPLNLTYARERMLLPESLDPKQTDPNFDPITQTATSGDDFSIMPVQVIFANGSSSQTIKFDVEIMDDTIHEADQVFVLTLEVISAVVDRNRLVPERADGLTSLGRIIDDDTIRIGFVQDMYTVFEAFNATGEVIPIPVIKGNNLQSELEFDVIAQFIDGSAQRDLGDTARDFITPDPRVILPFRTDAQFIEIGFELIKDRLPEDVEDFFIELTTSEAPRVDIGGGDLFGRTTVVIIDDDELTIGWERNLTTVNETQGPLELCLIIINVTESKQLTGFSVMLFIGTVPGTAADPGDYTEFRADSTFVFITDENRRACIDVVINNDTLLEEVEFFSVQVVPGPDGLSNNIQLDPDLTFVEIVDHVSQSCRTEYTVITLKVDEKSLHWPEAQIGQTVFANCTCGNVTIARAPRFCGGDIVTGAKWENPDVSACNIIGIVGEICLLNVDTGEVLGALEKLTGKHTNIGVAGVGIATFILERLASNVTQGQNRTMIESFLTVVDNLLEVDPLQLQESQQLFNTSARQLAAIQTVTDALPIPENESRAVIVLTSFAVAVQEIQADSVQQQSFSALLGGTLDGATNSKGLFFSMHPNATASVTLPATVISANVKTNTSIRIANSVYANDLLFLRREEESQEVGSIIISASISSRNSFENLDPPVLLTFIKNPNVENGTNTTCNFWDSAADTGFGDWSTRGCAVVSESEEDVICECDHLTNFAILLDVSPKVTGTSIPAGIKKTLEALSYIGAILSICFLILTIATYLSSKKLRSTEPSQILINICIGLLGIYILYIVAFHATAVSGLCVLAGVLVHYFLLATFFSMAADAILIFNKIIFVFVKIRRYVAIATIISWSVPAIIAVVTVAPDHDKYIDINFCRPYGIQFYAGLLAPFLVIYIFNWIIYTIIMVFLINHYFCKSETIKTEHNSSQIRQQFRNAIALSLLFGLGWAMGLPATEGIDSVSVRTAFQVLFIIVTAFQGLYIFIMQCLTGSNAVEAKKEWKRWFHLATCCPEHVHALSFTRSRTSASERMAGKQQLHETSTLTSLKALPSTTEELPGTSTLTSLKALPSATEELPETSTLTSLKALPSATEELPEMSTLTSLKALPSATEEAFDKVQYETELEMDTKLEEKSGEDKESTSVNPKGEQHTSLPEIEASEQLQTIPADAVTQPYDSSSIVLSNDN